MRDWLNRKARRLPRGAVWAAGLIPLALLVWDGVAGGLGADPVAVVEHRLGRTALYFLIATLAVTPLLRLARVNLMRFRRTLGLLAFGYAVLHVVAWVVLDMGLMWGQIGRDLVKRPYLVFGLGSFVVLLVLAVTSADCAIRGLGRWWRIVHRGVYGAVVLASLHWVLAGKIWRGDAVFWAVVVALLLGVRVVWSRRRAGGVSKMT